MEFTKRGAVALWGIISQCAEAGKFGILFLEDPYEGKTNDYRAVRYWKGVAAFLRAWADKIDEHADTLTKDESKDQ